MQKITAILAETGDLFGVTGPQTEENLDRIANALERIASALEKLTTEKKPEAVEAKIEQAPPNIIPISRVEPNLPVTPITSANTHGVIEKYLATHGAKELERTKIVKDKDREPRLNQTASYIGQHFPELKEFYQFLKQRVQIPNGTFTYSTIENTPTQKARIKILGKNLKEIGILENWIILPAPEENLPVKIRSI